MNQHNLSEHSPDLVFNHKTESSVISGQFEYNNLTNLKE